MMYSCDFDGVFGGIAVRRVLCPGLGTVRFKAVEEVS